MLAYLSRYTHRVAISNSRLVAMDERGVTFRWKNYRDKGSTSHKTMTLSAEEFMRRFVLHVLPGGLHRIRHFGLLANGSRRENLPKARALLGDGVSLIQVPSADAQAPTKPAEPARATFVCKHCVRPCLSSRRFCAGSPLVRRRGVCGPRRVQNQ